MSEEALVLSERDGAVATLTLNRPKALNALSVELMAELINLIEALDADDNIRCLVLTGGPRVFAAGADIKAMSQASPMDIIARGTVNGWERIRRCRKPIVA